MGGEKIGKWDQVPSQGKSPQMFLHLSITCQTVNFFIYLSTIYPSVYTSLSLSPIYLSTHHSSIFPTHQPKEISEVK